ncbi:hypothetical protein ACO2Q3_04295 [Caulobacter sp. KR2-114]|uniref:hypothetical protein n=1 Tax=Caulobacter sp. KR2-114 TaxID=3400912 RepID=UPI003C08D97D
MAFETRGVPHDQTLFLCIQQSRAVVLRCAVCSAEHVLAPDRLLAAFGDDLDATLEDLAAAAECGHCHSLNGVVSLQA